MQEEDRMTFTRVIPITQSTPLCPNCNKKMEIHKGMSGFHWYCPEYYKCGGIIMDVKND